MFTPSVASSVITLQIEVIKTKATVHHGTEGTHTPVPEDILNTLGINALKRDLISLNP